MVFRDMSTFATSSSCFVFAWVFPEAYFLSCHGSTTSNTAYVLASLFLVQVTHPPSQRHRIVFFLTLAAISLAPMGMLTYLYSMRQTLSFVGAFNS
jgi:hypothetical protein